MSKFNNIAWWLFPETIAKDDPVESAARLKQMKATHAFIYLGNALNESGSGKEKRLKQIHKLTEECRKVGIEVHGCFCSMARAKQPEAFFQHYENGKIGDILCPANPEVQDWIMGQLNFFLDEYPFTGINLEDSYVYLNNAAYDPANATADKYARMPTCYCDYCKEHAPDDALERKIYFENNLTSLVANISNEVKNKRKLTMSVAARMPYSRDFYTPYQKEIPYWDGWGVCQARDDFNANWVDWHHKNLIDFVCPMSYLHNTRIVELHTMEARSYLKNPQDNVWMGLGVDIMTAEYSTNKTVDMLNTPSNMRKQLEMLRNKGQNNVIFFAYYSKWVSDELVKIMNEYFA